MRVLTCRSRFARLAGICVCVVGVFASFPQAFAADFTVTTPNAQFAFNINGVNSATLTLVRGQTYTFQVNTTPGFHPFHIESPGVVNNDISTGTMTYTVPTAADNYVYFCTIHGLSMQGNISTIEPSSPPPSIKILSLSVSNNIVLISTATNTWNMLPEFNTDLGSTNWFALTVETNRFANGTNETICGRPTGTNVFIRIRATRK